MLGVVRLGGGEAAYGGWGSRALALEGLEWGKEGSENALGIPGLRASPATPLPTRQGIHLSPLPCLPNWAVQMASAPGPQRPWEGVGEAGELGFLGPRGLGTSCPISPPPGPATGQSPGFVQT